MLVMRHKAALVIHHLVGQAAGLAAFAAVGAAPGMGRADVTLSAVGHAQGAVDKELQRAFLRIGGSADGGNLLGGELTSEHDLRKTHILQKARLFRRADVGLGAGVQLQGRHVDGEQPHVLHDERIHAGFIQLPGLLARRFQLVISQDGIHGDKNAAVETVRMLHQARNVGHAVVGAGAGAEAGAADVDRVGPVVDGFDTDVSRAGGRQQFELEILQRHGAQLSQPLSPGGTLRRFPWSQSPPHPLPPIGLVLRCYGSVASWQPCSLPRLR